MKQIRDFFYSNGVSKPNPSRSVFVKENGKNTPVPVRDLLLPVCKIYEAFVEKHKIRVEDTKKPEDHPERFKEKAPVSLSKFYLLKPAECKKPTRSTGTLL